MNAGTRIIVFFKDPNGYVIELNEPLVIFLAKYPGKRANDGRAVGGKLVRRR